jgi:predicted dehydrogenase
MDNPLSPLNVGIIGIGAMGATHLKAYLARTDARVIGVADEKFASPGAAVGRAGNIPGQDGAVPGLDAIPKHATAAALLADPAIRAVDICAPTSAHKALALAAIRAGKHVLVEKPLARTSADAREIAAAARAAGVVLIPAHCMRFWPGWDWLKDAVATRRYGAVESASFLRAGARPSAPFYYDAAACGGAHFDLHIHDADFVLHLFGMPAAVTSFGRADATGAIVHTFTHYHFEGDTANAGDAGNNAAAGNTAAAANTADAANTAGVGALVTAEGAWTREAEARPFTMRYAVAFERASAVFDFGATPALTLFRAGHAPEPVPLAPGMGYEHEIAEFIRCAAAGRDSTVVTAEDGYRAIAIVEAETRSIESGTRQRITL